MVGEIAEVNGDGEDAFAGTVAGGTDVGQNEAVERGRSMAPAEVGKRQRL